MLEEPTLAVVAALVGVGLALLVGLNRARNADPNAVRTFERAAEQLGFILQTDRRFGDNCEDTCWDVRILGVHGGLTVVAGQIETDHLTGEPDGGRAEHSERVFELHVDLEEPTDLDVELRRKNLENQTESSGEIAEQIPSDEDLEAYFEIRGSIPAPFRRAFVYGRLDDSCERIRIAEGMLQLRFDREFTEPATLVEKVEEAVVFASRLQEQFRED